MDEDKMMAFVGQAVGDVGAMLGGAMAVIGDKLGLYRAMKGAGPMTSRSWPPPPTRRSDTSGSG